MLRAQATLLLEARPSTTSALSSLARPSHSDGPEQLVNAATPDSVAPIEFTSLQQLLMRGHHHSDIAYQHALPPTPAAQEGSRTAARHELWPLTLLSQGVSHMVSVISAQWTPMAI